MDVSFRELVRLCRNESLVAAVECAKQFSDELAVSPAPTQVLLFAFFQTFVSLVARHCYSELIVRAIVRAMSLDPVPGQTLVAASTVKDFEENFLTADSEVSSDRRN